MNPQELSLLIILIKYLLSALSHSFVSLIITIKAGTSSTTILGAMYCCCCLLTVLIGFLAILLAPQSIDIMSLQQLFSRGTPYRNIVWYWKGIQEYTRSL